MTDLHVARLSASVEGADSQRLVAILDQVAGGRLADALGRAPLPDGEWCVRRVDVPVAGDLDRPDGALATQWADAIVVALRQSLRDGSCDVVRFERLDDAVDDLLRGLALRDPGREWAWRQLGLLLPGDDPVADARGVAVRTLAGLPHGVAGALHRLVRRAGAAAVHRLLGVGGWTAVARLALRDLPGGAYDVPALLDPVATPDPVAPVAATREPAGSPARRRVEAMLLPADGLPRLLRDSRLRVDEATARAWAVLAVAAGEPRALLGVEAEAVLAELAGVLAGSPTGRSATRTRSVTTEGHPVEADQVTPDTERRATSGPAPTVPDSADDADAAIDRTSDPTIDPPPTRQPTQASTRASRRPPSHGPDAPPGTARSWRRASGEGCSSSSTPRPGRGCRRHSTRRTRVTAHSPGS